MNSSFLAWFLIISGVLAGGYSLWAVPHGYRILGKIDKNNVKQIEKKNVNEELTIQITSPKVFREEPGVIELDLDFSNGGKGSHSITSVKTLHSLYPTFRRPEKSIEQQFQDKNIEANHVFSLSSLLKVVVKSGEIVHKTVKISTKNPLETSPPKKLNYFIGLKIKTIDSHGDQHFGEYLIIDAVYADNPYDYGNSSLGMYKPDTNQLSFLFRGGKYELLGRGNKPVTPNPIQGRLFLLAGSASSPKESRKDSNNPAK